jgi:hypothetical protein
LDHLLASHYLHRDVDFVANQDCQVLQHAGLRERAVRQGAARAAQEAEANNLGEKEVAMSMAKVLRSYNDKLAPFKGQLREQGINLNDIAPRR